MRFHLAVTFLPVDEIVALSTACDQMGYSGVYFSDHLFNPRDLKSRYTYSEAPDGAPFWEKETEWPDPMCLISALSAVTTNLTFTTGIYIAPVRDLITVAKSVGTAAVLSHNRVRLGVGVGWCEEEYIQTGQDFHSRGKRLNDMIPALAGPVAGRLGGVPRDPLRRPTLPDEPDAHLAGAHPVRWGLRGGHAYGPLPCATGGSTPGRRSRTRRSSRPSGSGTPSSGWVGRTSRISVYLAVKSYPDVDLYRRLEDMGVTDILCAPWMAVRATDGDTPESHPRQTIGRCAGSSPSTSSGPWA